MTCLNPSREMFGVPFDYADEKLRKRGERLRLLPPHREQLSQAFARFFMRVDLPIELPEDPPY